MTFTKIYHRFSYIKLIKQNNIIKAILVVSWYGILGFRTQHVRRKPKMQLNTSVGSESCSGTHLSCVFCVVYDRVNMCTYIWNNVVAAHSHTNHEINIFTAFEVYSTNSISFKTHSCNYLDMMSSLLCVCV